MPLTFDKATVYLALAKQNAEAGNPAPAVAIGFRANGTIRSFAVADQRTQYDSRSADLYMTMASMKSPRGAIHESWPLPSA